MRAWLKLVGTAESPLPETWAHDRRDLLSEARFGEAHPPHPISRGDRLVYHAVRHHRIVAIVEVTDEDALQDPHPSAWGRKWPLIREVRPLLRVSRVSMAPSSSSLGDLPDRTHQGFLPLTPEQLTLAEELLHEAGAH